MIDDLTIDVSIGSFVRRINLGALAHRSIASMISIDGPMFKE